MTASVRRVLISVVAIAQVRAVNTAGAGSPASKTFKQLK